MISLLRKFVIWSRYLRHVGNIAIAAMVLLTTADVIGRYIFNSPIIGALEITEYLMIMMVWSFLGYAQYKKSHVNVDIVFKYLPERVQAVLNRLNHLICFIMIFLLTWMTVVHTLDLKADGEGSTLLDVPDYPFAIFMVFGCVILAGEFLTDVILGPERAEPEKG